MGNAPAVHGFPPLITTVTTPLKKRQTSAAESRIRFGCPTARLKSCPSRACRLPEPREVRLLEPQGLGPSTQRSVRRRGEGLGHPRPEPHVQKLVLPSVRLLVPGCRTLGSLRDAGGVVRVVRLPP